MFPRNLLQEIKKYLYTDDIIVIHGARQTGKSSLLKILMEKFPTIQTYYIDLEDSRFLTLCENGIEKVIEYLTEKGIYTKQEKFYLFIDEIQYLRNPSSFLKITHDHFPFIKLIVTGSSSFEIKRKFKDTLVGRTVSFELFPLDFQEFLWFKEQKIEINKPVSNEIIIKELQILFSEYAQFGGYPKIVLTPSVEMKEKYLQQIIDTYIKGDIRDLGGIKNIEKFNKLLRILASQSGQLINITEISNTAQLARQTVEEYLFILENTYILKLVPPFSQNLRSELFKTPKIFFYDTGIMNMLAYNQLPMQISGEGFETCIFSEFAKKTGTKNIYYWRTQDKKEIDFIVSNKNKLLPFEVKINAHQFKTTAINYFVSHYKLTDNYCISLTGDIRQIDIKTKKIFPWELGMNL